MGIKERLRSWDDAYESAVDQAAPDQRRYQRLLLWVFVAFAVPVVVAKAVSGDYTLWGALASTVLVLGAVFVRSRRRPPRRSQPSRGR